MLSKLLICWLILINLALFILMGEDKAAAKRNHRRIPESTLLGMAVIGGGAGGLLGMLLFRHKTRKPAFFIGIPVIVLVEAAVGYWLFSL